MKSLYFLTLFFLTTKAFALSCHEDRYLQLIDDGYIELLEDGANILSVLEKFEENIEDKSRCPDPEEIEDKKEFIIAFDGSSGFSPLQFEFEKFQALLRQRMKADNSLNAQIIAADKLVLKTYLSSLERESEKKLSTGLRKMLFQKELKMTSDKSVLYYGHGHYRKALRCVRQIKELRPNATLKVMGYSWGGDTAQRLVNKLEKDNIPIHSVFTIDPVRKGFLGFGVIKNMVSKRNAPFFEKKSNVGKYFNFYQKTDNGSLVFSKIFGNQVQAADLNVNLSEECYTSEKARAVGSVDDNVHHLNLRKCLQIQEQYKKFFKD